MKGLIITSLLLTILVLGNAYHHKKHFYPMMIYLTKSNSSLVVIFLQVIILFVLAGKLCGTLFFGELSASETEVLMEKAWGIFTDSGFAFATFRSDYNPQFMLLLCVYFFLKSAHVLAEERIGYMERSPVIPMKYHLRMLSLAITLGTCDAIFVDTALRNVWEKGLSWHIAFGLEYSILFIVISSVLIKYILHCIEISRLIPRENKEVAMLHVEVALGGLKMILYACCAFIIIANQGPPYFLIRPFFNTYDVVNKSLSAIILSRRAVRVMNSLFPKATREDLASFDNVCIICREDFSSGEESRKLPCGHIFHTACLRLWFQRQQNCPTCRMSVLNLPEGFAERQRSHGGGRKEPNQEAGAERPGTSSEREVTRIADRFSLDELYAYLQNILKDLPVPEDLEGLPQEEVTRLTSVSKEIIMERLNLLKVIKGLLDTSVFVMEDYCEFLDNQLLSHNPTSHVGSIQAHENVVVQKLDDSQ